MNRTKVSYCTNVEKVNGIVETMDLAIPKCSSDKYAWANEGRWTFGSLPRLDLLDIYGRQFSVYTKSNGLFETMVHLKDAAARMTSDQTPKVSTELQTKVEEIVNVRAENSEMEAIEMSAAENREEFPNDGDEMKRQRKSVWKRLRRYLQKRTMCIRRLFKRRR